MEVKSSSKKSGIFIKNMNFSFSIEYKVNKNYVIRIVDYMKVIKLGQTSFTNDKIKEYTCVYTPLLLIYGGLLDSCNLFF